MRVLTAAAALAVLGCIGLPASTLAQETGTVAGVVKDTSGAVLPGVTVKAALYAVFGLVRTTVTDGTGQYRIDNVPAGVYSVAISLPGFTTVSREFVEVKAGSTTNVNVEMKVARPTEVEVFAIPRGGPLVNRPPVSGTNRPTVICGLTIVPADPTMDPNIRVPVEGKTRPTIRTIEPSICWNTPSN